MFNLLLVLNIIKNNILSDFVMRGGGGGGGGGFMLSLSDKNQADVIGNFNSTSRYLDDLLDIDNLYFEQTVRQIYPTKLQLNKANSYDTEVPYLDLDLSIKNGIVYLRFRLNGMILILK